MLLRFIQFVGMGISSVALANFAFAEGANVTTDATSAKLGGEFHAGFMYTDNGLWKMDGFTPSASSGFDVWAANVKMDGKINAKTDYSFKFNLLDNTTTGKTPLTHGYGTHWFASNFGVSFGRMKVKQGGFDQMHNEYFRTSRGPLVTEGSGHFAFGHYEDMAAIHVKAGGDLTIQLVNDVQGNFNTEAHPTFILNWAGDFNGISPAIGYGSYDNNKSYWLDLGVGVDMTKHMKNSGVMASLDIFMKTDTFKYVDGKDTKTEANGTTSYSLWAGYNMAGTGMPWFYFSSLDVKQSDKSAFGEDIKFNSMATDATGAVTGYNWDDNGTVIGVGFDATMFGNGWTPYGAITTRSGKWQDLTDPTKEETKSDMNIMLGAHGRI